MRLRTRSDAQMHAAMLALISLWLVLDGGGLSEPALFSVALPTAAFEEGQQALLRGADGPCGAVVMHKAREGFYAHGVLTAAARAGEVRVVAGPWEEVFPAATRAEGAVRAGKPVFAPGGVVAWAGHQLVPWPPPDSGEAWAVVHSCALREESRCEVLADQGALRWRLYSVCSPATARWELTLHVQALRETVLPQGLGLEVRDGRWPFATEAVAATRSRGGWASGEGAGVLEPWPLTLGGAASVAPQSEHALWYAQAARLEGEEHSYRLLVLSSGATLHVGEGRIVRMSFAVDARGGIPSALVLNAAPHPATTELERLTADSVKRLLEDATGGLRRFDLDAGDWMHASGVAGNLEYDSVAGLWAHAQQCGNLLAARASGAMLDHLLSVDRQPDRGFFHEHGRGHRTGRFEAGHHWIGGSLRRARDTRDALSLEIVSELLAAQRKELAVMEPRVELPRSLGWGLLAAADALSWDKRDAQHTKLVRRWRSFLMAASRPSGLLVLQDRETPSTAAVLDVFVLGGVVLPALVRSCEVLVDDDLRQRLKVMARALWRAAVSRDEKGEPYLSESVPLDPGSGVAGKGCGRLAEAKALLVLAGLLSADSSLQRDARFPAVERGLVTTLRETQLKYCGLTTALLLRAEMLRADAVR